MTNINKIITENNLTMDSVFVPFSQSRNAEEKHFSLNWKVTLKINGKEIVTTDYMQGIGHAPCYKKQPKFSSGRTDNYIFRKMQEIESERGNIAANMGHGSAYDTKKKIPAPDIKDVLYSLVLDSDVLDHDSFESWADDFGYDKDSRAAEKIYKACLDIALKMRSWLGDSVMSELKTAYQDY